jgi:benzodiazapine receptor
MSLKQSDWSRLIAPMTFGLLMSRICPNAGRGDAKVLAAQPPGFVFGIVWPILYIFIGIAWMLSKRAGVPGADILFLLNMVFINAWIWFYGCKNDKRTALWTFVPSIATALMLMFLVYQGTSKKYGWWPAGLLAPYVAWLTFASQLSFARVSL